MDKVKTADFIDNILLELPGCPSVVVEKALERAIRDWYKDTHCWKEPLPKFTTEDGVNTYLALPPSCTKILALDAMLVDGKPMASYDYALSLPKTIIFSKEPKPAQVVTPVAVLSTSNGAVSVPCDHVSQWLDDWLHGAIWYLRMQVGMPWYEPNEAERNRQLFRSAILNQRNRQNTGYRTGDLQVSMKRFI